jgi:ribosomal protein L37AE/L43A
MELIVGAVVLVAGVLGVRHMATPVCPRCKRRNWNRKLAAPLLLCRKCATRVDSRGRLFN